MTRPDLNDTIAAIATSFGDAGIGIVRLSGKGSLRVADAVFVAKSGRKPSKMKSYSLQYGWICDKQVVIDEVLLTVMRRPRSYTKEDVVEINCHGGVSAQRAVLDRVLDAGARLAEPGEFTRRAFLNGRIDLAQAQAVLDIIRAKTDAARKISIGQLKGRLSEEINACRARLLKILAQLQASIDFPDDDTGQDSAQDMSLVLAKIAEKLKRLIDSAAAGLVMREGVHVVICGRPNVGKSSLLNALLRKERSIVTPVAGTTRDTIEEIIDIRGIPIRIVDTAGIIEPGDLIEKKAVARSQEQMRNADIILLVFDGSKRLTRHDALLMRACRKTPVIAVINKIDLGQRIEKAQVLSAAARCVEISVKKGKHINLLEDALVDMVYSGAIEPGESAFITDRRHLKLVAQARKAILSARASLRDNLSAEFIADDIQEALRPLDELLGRSFSQDVLDKIFSEFCIGK